MKKISHRYVRKTAAGVVALSMLCAAAIPSVLAMPAGAASASGDLNGDGSVTAADVAILQTSLLGGTALTAEQYANADVTGRYVGICTNVAIQLCHEALTKRHDLTV